MMKTTQEYVQLIKQHQPELMKRYGVNSLRLFGSVARGEQHEGSDVDICIEAKATGLLGFVSIRRFFERILKTPVDLVRINPNMDIFFKEQIEKDGILVF